MPIEFYNNFQPGDLLYGQEEQRKWHHSPLRNTVVPGEKTTVDQYNKELPGTGDPDNMQEDTLAYYNFLQREPGTRAITDPSSGLDRDSRLKRSCTAMIEFKTRQGCAIHFELQGVDLESYPDSFTETELRYILENRHFLNLRNIKFYRDGQLLNTTGVIDQHRHLVDEVLDRGQVIQTLQGPQIFDSLGVERYDRYQPGSF
jgi:hypothetical protein